MFLIENMSTEQGSMLGKLLSFECERVSRIETALLYIDLDAFMVLQHKLGGTRNTDRGCDARSRVPR